MIEFLTLFLTLTLGNRPLELAIDEAVAQQAGMVAVEIRLDGEPVATLTKAPWTLEVDFGDRLVPHELEVVAINANGEELDRIGQLVNYGRSEYEARLVLDRSAGTARVLWQAAKQARPRKVTVLYDGAPVPVDERGYIDLPPDAFTGLEDPSQAHVLEARLEFKGGHRANAELSFGGAHGLRITSDLTALAVTLPAGMEPPHPAGMEGWFHMGGERLAVFQVERGPARVILVRDRNLPSPLPLEPVETMETRRLLGMRGGALPDTRGGATVGMKAGAPDSANVPVVGGALQPEDEIQVIATTPQRVAAGAGTTAVFPIAEYRQGADFPRKLLRAAWLLRPAESFRQDQRLFDAVAAAGDAVAKTARRRAVLILLDPRSKDASAVRAEQAFQYLASLRVPAFVWTASRVRKKSPAAALQLGDAPRHGTELAPLVETLGRELDRQVVVWLEGRHLPQQVTLSPEAPEGVAFAR